MSQKRQRARAALLEWSLNTSPEQFIAEHKGIIFPKCNHDVKVELVSTPDRLRKYYRKFSGITTNESYQR